MFQYCDTVIDVLNPCCLEHGHAGPHSITFPHGWVEPAGVPAQLTRKA